MMATGPSSGESSTTPSSHQQQAATQSPNSSDGWQHALARRRALQQDCLQPGGLARSPAFTSHESAWRCLLGISQEELQSQRLPSLEESVKPVQRTASGTSAILQESLFLPIPLDKDGWQVTDDDLLQINASSTPSHGSAVEHRDEWKVVKSRKTKRRKEGNTASMTFPSEFASRDQSLHSSITVSAGSSASSTPALSPNAGTSVESTKDGVPELPPTPMQEPHSGPLTDRHQFPNLSSRDIEQVVKDVERSFIGPAFEHMSTRVASEADEKSNTPFLSEERDFRRRQLTHLVLTTLSKRPSLSYFQGYHDILSVVLLTIAPVPPKQPTDIGAAPSSAPELFVDKTEQALVELIAERISLHIIRDSMTRDLLPIMGQLKVLGNLLRLCDPMLAELVDRASPVPFFALPWLLTLLTHDATEVAVMQSVLVFVLAYGPAAAIYLCAAVLLTRKEEIFAMDQEDLEDPAMLHMILSKLPPIRADEVDGADGEGICAAKETPQSTTEVEDKGKDQGKTQSPALETNAIYIDPDVEPPSLASDRALAAFSHTAQSSTKAAHRYRRATPISALLKSAVELMDRFPLHSDEIQVHKIMGPSSVLFTWPRVFLPHPDVVATTCPPGTSGAAYEQGSDEVLSTAASAFTIDWSAQNLAAEQFLAGPTEAIVLDPHPGPPTPAASDSAEKQPPPPSEADMRKRKREWDLATTNARMLAVVGISGLLVAALFTASQNPASSARLNVATHETNKVLTLIVSLLSNWGRVVGSA